MVFAKTSDELLAAEIAASPLPVLLKGPPELTGWGQVAYDQELMNPASGLRRIAPKEIWVKADLGNDQKLAVLVHEQAHVDDLSHPWPVEVLHDAVRTERVAYEECLRRLLHRRLFLPMLWEMFTIEWDSEEQGDCLTHRTAAQQVHESSVWEACRTAIIHALNANPPVFAECRISWDKHPNAFMVETGGPMLVVCLSGGDILDFAIRKDWLLPAGKC